MEIVAQAKHSAIEHIPCARVLQKVIQRTIPGHSFVDVISLLFSMQNGVRHTSPLCTSQ
jgi:hypothetical protein